ncbi:MAG: xylulokinase [Parvibaculaceae bacterium]
MAYIGLDIGTSAVKALLIGETDMPLAHASEPLVTAHPHPLWSEQDPDIWWQAALKALAHLRREAPDAWRNVKGLGLSGQMHGAVLLDRSHRVIRPAILWNDGRSAADAEALNRTLPDLGRVAGVPAMPGFTAPKLLWLAREEPQHHAKIAMILLPKDHVRFRLTGEFATDMTDASGTGWLDVGKRRWSDPILAATGISTAMLPRLGEGPEVSGQLLPAIADELGLPRGLPVAFGAGDATAAACGLGAINDGDGFISLGTSAQYFIAAGAHRPAPQTFIHAYAHALPQRWAQIAALLNGGSALAWAAELFGHMPIAALLEETERNFTSPSPVLFLPYLTGERTPHNDPAAKGVLYGLTPGMGRSDLIQAVLEGVAFALADGEAALTAAGSAADILWVTGGGARSALWMRILANVLARPLEIDAGNELGPALGAARLARMAVTGETAAHICRKPSASHRVEPDRALAQAYGERRERFRLLYRSLRDSFRFP